MLQLVLSVGEDNNNIAVVMLRERPKFHEANDVNPVHGDVESQPSGPESRQHMPCAPLTPQPPVDDTMF